MPTSSGSASAERRLRLEVEAVVDAGAMMPAAYVAAALDALEAAAVAAVRAGAVPAETGAAVIREVVDALVVRGASWLTPSMPDLDITRLYDAAAGGRGPALRRVVPVVATLDHGTITSVELWSDRVVARVVGRDGGVEPSHVVGAAGVGDRRLDLRDASGGVVGVDLTGGRALRESPGAVVPATAARVLDRLVHLEVARARRGGTVDELNAARRRVAAAVAVLDAPEDALDAFDAAVTALPSGRRPAPVLVDVMALAQRFYGGWLLSLEQWRDHWRVVVVAEDGIRNGAGGPPAWTAVDGAGTRYGGVPIADDVLRFDPALPSDWSSLVLERHDPGEILEVEVLA